MKALSFASALALALFFGSTSLSAQDVKKEEPAKKEAPAKKADEAKAVQYSMNIDGL